MAAPYTIATGSCATAECAAVAGNIRKILNIFSNSTYIKLNLDEKDFELILFFTAYAVGDCQIGKFSLLSIIFAMCKSF